MAYLHLIQLSTCQLVYARFEPMLASVEREVTPEFQQHSRRYQPLVTFFLCRILERYFS
jgi:hypothetical protein